ncbi:MAG: hypothetical protein JSW14_06415 [Candidatus Bathyarchaeum sp.]|nr:MAG: hypothetical protein JSW14_06415 [Candidatus Bathyarchaeum sp.]
MKQPNKKCTTENYFALSRVTTSTPTLQTKCRQKPTFKTICKVAKNIDEATELIENGFEYVT